MSSCENCRLRAKYDSNPGSLLARLWKWHLGWCPGWKRYLKTLPEKEREELMSRYN